MQDGAGKISLRMLQSYASKHGGETLTLDDLKGEPKLKPGTAVVCGRDGQRCEPDAAWVALFMNPCCATAAGLFQDFKPSNENFINQQVCVLHSCGLLMCKLSAAVCHATPCRAVPLLAGISAVLLKGVAHNQQQRV